MKNRKIIIAIALVVAIAIIGKIAFEVYDIYSATVSLNEADIKEAMVTKSVFTNADNIEILDKCEEDGYVAYLITYTQYEEEYIGCCYLEPSNVLKHRYYFKGGDRVRRGELGHYSIGEIGKGRIVVFGLDLPDDADKYCLDFFELDTQVMGKIKDNKVFKLYVVEDDIDNYINSEIKLLDEEYKEIN